MLWLSAESQALYVEPRNGVTLPIPGGYLLPNLAASVTLQLGTIPAGGLAVPILIPDPGVPAVHVYCQALIVSPAATGGWVLSNGQTITLLDSGP